MKDSKAFCQSLTSADNLRHWFIYIFVVQRSYQTQISLSTSVQEQSPEHATPSNRQKYRSQNSSGLDVNNEEKLFQKYSNHHCSFFFLHFMNKHLDDNKNMI